MLFLFRLFLQRLCIFRRLVGQVPLVRYRLPCDSRYGKHQTVHPGNVLPAS